MSTPTPRPKCRASPSTYTWTYSCRRGRWLHFVDAPATEQLGLIVRQHSMLSAYSGSSTHLEPLPPKCTVCEAYSTNERSVQQCLRYAEYFVAIRRQETLNTCPRTVPYIDNFGHNIVAIHFRTHLHLKNKLSPKNQTLVTLSMYINACSLIR